MTIVRSEMRHCALIAIAAACQILAGVGVVAHAEERPVAQSQSELNELKQRLERVERLLAPPPTQTSFEPPTVPPEPETFLPPRQFEAPAAPPQRNWNLSSLGRIFQRDEYPTVNWSGFLQLDTGWISQSQANREAVGDIGSKTGLRRVRLRVDGFVRQDTGYVIDLDFAASGHPSFRNVALTFGDVPEVQNVILGYFKTPFGMDALTSGRELLLLERQLPFAFAPFRQTGLGIFGTSDDELTTYNAALFAFPTDSFGVTTGTSGGASLAGRVTHLLVYENSGSRLLHVGFGYALGDPDDNIVEYRIQPGFFVTDPANPDVDPSAPTIVDTGAIPAKLFNLLNLEVGMAIGPFHLQSEGRVAMVSQIGGPLLVFPGAYVQMGLLLTGEHTNYDRKLAIFRRVLPDHDFELGGGGGAWELAFGYSFINLNDKNIQGGLAQTFTIGLNWYLDKHAKFMINLAPFTLQDPAFGFSTAFLAALRAQVEF